MAITKADVLVRFAEFATIGDPEWAAVIADATLQVNAAVLGTKATLATIYLAAHLVGSAHPNLIPRGRVTLAQMDGVQYRYAVADHAADQDSLDATPYGRMYKSLLRRSAAGRMLVP